MKKSYFVFFRNEFTAFPKIPTLKEILSDYKKVAVVKEVEDLDEIFESCNTIDHHWSENKNVVAFESQLRSMSTGDVVFDVKDKIVWYCDRVGWTQIDS